MSFSSLAATVTSADHLLATERCSCFHYGGFEQDPYRRHVIKFAGRWKSCWVQWVAPQKPNPTNLLTVQSFFTCMPRTVWVTQVWWSKVNHWALARSALIQGTLKRPPASPAWFVIINRWLKSYEGFPLQHTITLTKTCYYQEGHFKTIQMISHTAKAPKKIQ